MATERNPLTRTVKDRRRRYLVLGFGIFALTAVIVFGPGFREQEPNYYNPARAALVNARLLFLESLEHEEELITQLQEVRKELDSAINQLGRAADLDRGDRAKIEELRSGLQSIERSGGSGELSSQELDQSYRDLLAQMDVLIAELDHRGR